MTVFPSPEKQLSIEIVTAMTHERGLADDGNGRALWKIPEDLQNFRATTEGHVMAIAAATFQSMRYYGHPLFAGRINYIVGDPGTSRIPIDHVAVSTIDRAQELAEKRGARRLFVVGNADFYEQALKRVQKLHITFVDGDYETSERFPDFEDEFEQSTVASVKGSDNGYDYLRQIYIRKPQADQENGVY